MKAIVTCSWLLFASFAAAALAAPCKLAQERAGDITVWDDKTQDFKCVHGGAIRTPEDHSGGPPDTLDNTEQCQTMYVLLARVCLKGAAGAACRKKAAAYLCRCAPSLCSNVGSDSDHGGAQPKTDPAMCRRVYEKEVAACRMHPVRPPQKGNNAPQPDTCARNALTERDQCLALSK